MRRHRPKKDGHKVCPQPTRAKNDRKQMQKIKVWAHHSIGSDKRIWTNQILSRIMMHIQVTNWPPNPNPAIAFDPRAKPRMKVENVRARIRPAVRHPIRIRPIRVPIRRSESASENENIKNKKNPKNPRRRRRPRSEQPDK